MLEKNKFFDINTFPESKGILIWGISINRIDNAQSGKKCFDYLQHIDTKIKKTSGIGLNFWYADYLNLISKNKADFLRDKILNAMWRHKNEFGKILAKNVEWIPKAFNYITLGQVLLDNAHAFQTYFPKVKKFYKDDKKFRQYILDDCKNAGKSITANDKKFILEEITLFYLNSKGKIVNPNEYINNHEKWILFCYPGKPLKSEVYLYQKNPCELSNPNNKYENCYYDLSDKILYDYSRLDIETFDFN